MPLINTDEPFQFELRSDTTENWTNYNPVLAAGEPGVDTQTHILKVGDGLTRWLELPAYVQFDTASGAFNDDITGVLDQRYGVQVVPERFGAVGDKVTDDAAAFQAAINALATFGGGGALVLDGRKTYRLGSSVIVPSNTTIDGNGATVYSTQGSSKTTFVNQSQPNAIGYGAGGQNIHFRNLRFVGDYTVVQGDVGTGWNHVDNLSFTNCSFEQGMSNGHYIDLGGCSRVRVINCTFLGMNPVANRNYIEAVQVDVNTMQASSNKQEPASAFDGLPTRDVLIQGCYFGEITVAGVTYPAPNPVGSHTVALESDAGWYENIQFVNNTVRGTYKPATQAVSGWCHFYGARGVNVSGNTFIWTGTSGTSGNPQVVSFTQATSVIPASDVALASPGSVTLATPRQCSEITVANNRFIGFAAAPTQADTGLINLDRVNRASVCGNTCNGAPSSFVRGVAARVIVQGNDVNSNSTEPVISIADSSYAQVKDNTISAGTGGIGIRNSGGSHNQFSNNTVGGGAVGILINGLNNGLVQDNYVVNFTTAGISIGETGNAATVYDLILSTNRAGSSTSSATCLLIGATSTRTRRIYNLLRGPGTVTDNGSGTTGAATDAIS